MPMSVASTWTDQLDVLLAVAPLPSASAMLTVATLTSDVSAAAAVGRTTTAISALSPTPRLPRGQVTIPLLWVQGPPRLGVARTNVVLAGRVSVTLTPLIVALGER